MRMSTASLLLCLAALTVPGAARAAEDIGAAASNTTTDVLSKGAVEYTPMLSFSYQNLSFSENGSSSDGGSIMNLSGTGLVGYSVTDRWQVVGGVLINYESLNSPGAATESATSIGFLGGAQYNFAARGTMIPFLRGQVGLATNSGNLSLGDQMSWVVPIVDAGVRWLIGSSASVNASLGYQHRTKALGLEGMSAHVFGLGIGVSIFTRHL